MVQLTGIRLTDVRTFEGEQFISIAPGLTVLVGRNNAGKSTVLRAPFLLPGPGPHASFCRSGAKYSEIALQMRIPAADLQRVAGFAPARLKDVQVAAASGHKVVPITNHSGFADWEARPLVEFGWHIAPPASAMRTVRFVSNSDASESLQLFQKKSTPPRLELASKWAHVATAEVDWFGPALAAFSDPNGGLPPNFLAHWEHERVRGVTDWIAQHTRRLVDTGESRLQETLTFLKMKHDGEFERISRALARALPEFERLDFIDVDGTGSIYRPAFVARGHASDVLARENIGSGAWTYLCILTAARAAKATGARVLFLDEPHLYLHPGLERLLIDELLDAQEWDDEPLQIVAATHSPTFVDAAVERGTLHILDWTDEKRTGVSVRTVTHDTAGAMFDSLTSRPSELLYADRLVFVEGPSDVVALRILARERCGARTPARYVPLKETDAIASEVARYFSVIIQGHGLGFRVRGLLVLDGDKQAALEAAWDKLDASLDPRKTTKLKIVWATGRNGNDIESIFCDSDFLVAYFDSKGVAPTSSLPTITGALAKLAYPATKRGQKGCVAIRELHEALLGTAGATKADDLEVLMHFYTANADEPYAAAPRKHLAELEAALRELDAA
jgi:hypothetical protein